MSIEQDILGLGTSAEVRSYALKVTEEYERQRVRRDAQRLLDAEASESYKGTEELSWDDLFVVPMTWIVQDIMARDSLVFLVGKSNVGKTFLYLDMVLNTVLGRPFMGKATTPTKTLIVLGEGLAGFGARIEAWCAANNAKVEDVKPWLSFTRGANLNNATSLGLLQESAERNDVGLIVFDTYAATSGVMSEDDAALNAATLNAAKTIKPGATLLFAHHPRKSSEEGTNPVLRGSGALAGAADVVLTLWDDKDFKSAGPKHNWLALSTEHAHGGKNRNARTETLRGLYLAQQDDTAVMCRDKSSSLSTADLSVLEHLKDGMTSRQFMAAAGVSQATADRHLKSGLVRKGGTSYYLA